MQTDTREGACTNAISKPQQSRARTHARTDGDEPGDEEARVPNELEDGQRGAREVHVPVPGRRVLVPAVMCWDMMALMGLMGK